MTQLSKERLEEIRDYDTCVTREELAEMARRLLAAEAQEPVAFLIRDKYTPNGYFSHTNATVNISQEDICEHEVSATPLYAAMLKESE